MENYKNPTWIFKENMENSLIKDWITVIFWLILAAPLIIIVMFITLLAFIVDWIKLLIWKNI